MTFKDIPLGFRDDTKLVLFCMGRPDHPIVRSNVTLAPRRAAPPRSIEASLVHLRIFTKWAQARGLSTFAEVSQKDIEIFTKSLRDGSANKDNTTGVKPSTLRGYLGTLRKVSDCKALLNSPLSFKPYAALRIAKVAGDVNPSENLTQPLPWEIWSALIAASWFVIRELSSDILAANDRLREATVASSKNRGPGGVIGLERLNAYLTGGGIIPLATGFGRIPTKRGAPLLGQLSTLAEVSVNIFKPAHHSYNPEAATLVSTYLDRGHGVFGGFYIPETPLESDSDTPWLGEIGRGEAEHLPSILRASCYIIIASLSGMRDSELQELKKNCIEERDGLKVLKSIQQKGYNESLGHNRFWWIPEPVIKAIEVLEKLSDYDCLFGRTYLTS